MFGVALREDENTSASWATTRNGRATFVGVGAAITGRRGVERSTDDAMNAIDAVSKAVRDSTYGWFGSAFTTRLDGDGPIIVVGQRLCVDDLPGAASRARGRCSACRANSIPRDGACCSPTTDRSSGGTLAPSPASCSRRPCSRARSSTDSGRSSARWRTSASSTRTHRATRTRCAPRVGGGSFARGPSVVAPPVATSRPRSSFRRRSSASSSRQTSRLDRRRRRLRGRRRRWCGRLVTLRARRVARTRRPSSSSTRSHGSLLGIHKPASRSADGAAVIETLKRTIWNTVEPMVPSGSEAQRLASVIGQIDNGQVLLADGASWLDDARRRI